MVQMTSENKRTLCLEREAGVALFVAVKQEQIST